MHAAANACEVYDALFRDIIPDGAGAAELAGGMLFTEGPVWMSGLGGLVLSDIDGDELKLFRSGGLSTFRKPSGHANGNTLDRQGRLITCEHGNRRVSRTEADGSVVTLADSFVGKRLNSPNDVVVKSDHTIWFTDPPYGIKPEQQEQEHSYVFRLDPDGVLAALCGDFDRPNGLCFSPDEQELYIADSSRRSHIRRFVVRSDNTLEGGEVFATISPGVPDGMRVDPAGRLFSTAGDGVWVIHPDGRLLGKILVPQVPANCAFGGGEGKTLYITARHSLYSIDVR